MQSSKYKTEISHEPRRKFRSLRSLTSHDLPASTVTMQKCSFDQLERSLNRDNNLQQQPLSEPVAVIPGFEQEVIQGKLWGYFSSKMQAVQGKVEKEQVNCREKYYWIIKQQVSNLQTTYARQAAQIENVIKEKYKLVHGLFEEIKQERSTKAYSFSPKGKKGKKQVPILDNTQRLVALKEHVQLIRGDVLSLEIQLGKVNQDSEKIKREWITFLKSILKGGLYLKDGMKTILKEMIGAEYGPTLEDMPNVLDQTSKKCLLQQYQLLKVNGKKTARQLPLQFQRSRILSQARQSLSEIARRDLVRQVYKDTQQFMANLVKQSDWRTTIITLPNIKTPHKQSVEGWQDYERKRITSAYNGQGLIKAKGILFGWKVQSSQ